MRENLPPDRFEEAFYIAQADYASDPALQTTLVSYVLMDWAKHDARAATRAATRAAASAGEGDRSKVFSRRPCPRVRRTSRKPLAG
ncbi:MAG: hypothetical protein R3F11_21385 [Verrucomicrobiales bacterium]